MRVDGTNLMKLNTETTGYLLVAGDWIYYVNYDDGSTLYKMRTDGSDKMKLTSDKTSGVNFISGDWIYYNNLDDNYALYRVTLEGQQRQKITSNISGARYTLHNNVIYFINLDDERRIYSMNLDGTNPVRIGDDTALSMNISGPYIFYTTPGTPPGGDLYRMGLDGSGRTLMAQFVINYNILGDWIYYRSSTRNLYAVKVTGEDRRRIFDVTPEGIVS